MKRFLFLILFLTVLVSFGNEGWIRLYRLKKVEHTLQGKNRLLSEDSKSLRTEIGHLRDAKYLETYIREELGYVKDNEILYTFRGEAANHQSP